MKLIVTEPFIVNDLALVQFKLRHAATRTLEPQLSFKKNSKINSLVSELKLKVTSPNFVKEWNCTGDWTEANMTPKKPDLTVNDTLFTTLEVKINLHETKTAQMQAQKLYEDDELVDFHLSSADGKVGIHKTLLAMQSDVFMMMLKREWKETLEGQIGIEGVTKQTLQDFKQYMYLGTLPEDGLEPLLVIAERYMMYELKADCISRIVHAITPEKLDNLVEFACLNNVPDLMRALLVETPSSIAISMYEMNKNKEQAKEEKEKDK